MRNVMVVALGAVLGVLCPARANDKPNILFFITDDESWLERSAYDWSTLPTPHFDRVAREGVLFTNAFTSAPSCAPSRASVLTGRNFWELRQGAFIQAFIPRQFIVTGLEWHGEFDPVSRSSRSIRNDLYAYVLRYRNVDDQGKALNNEALIRPAQIEFYDLKNDPWQQKDLADDPAFAQERKRLAEKLRKVGMQTRDPRVTGEMDLFRQTRQYAQKRKRMGYTKTVGLPFPEARRKKGKTKD